MPPRLLKKITLKYFNGSTQMKPVVRKRALSRCGDARHDEARSLADALAFDGGPASLDGEAARGIEDAYHRRELVEDGERPHSESDHRHQRPDA